MLSSSQITFPSSTAQELPNHNPEEELAICQEQTTPSARPSTIVTTRISPSTATAPLCKRENKGAERKGAFPCCTAKSTWEAGFAPTHLCTQVSDFLPPRVSRDLGAQQPPPGSRPDLGAAPTMGCGSGLQCCARRLTAGAVAPFLLSGCVSGTQENP